MAPSTKALLLSLSPGCAPSAPDCASNLSFTLWDANKPFLGARNLSQQVSGTPVGTAAVFPQDPDSVVLVPGGHSMETGPPLPALGLPAATCPPTVPAPWKTPSTPQATESTHCSLAATCWFILGPRFQVDWGCPCHAQAGLCRGAGCGGLPLSLQHSCGRWQRLQPESNIAYRPSQRCCQRDESSGAVGAAMAVGWNGPKMATPRATPTARARLCLEEMDVVVRAGRVLHPVPSLAGRVWGSSYLAVGERMCDRSPAGSTSGWVDSPCPPGIGRGTHQPWWLWQDRAPGALCMCRERERCGEPLALAAATSPSPHWPPKGHSAPGQMGTGPAGRVLSQGGDGGTWHGLCPMAQSFYLRWAVCRRGRSQWCSTSWPQDSQHRCHTDPGRGPGSLAAPRGTHRTSLQESSPEHHSPEHHSPTVPMGAWLHWELVPCAWLRVAACPCPSSPLASILPPSCACGMHGECTGVHGVCTPMEDARPERSGDGGSGYLCTG